MTIDEAIAHAREVTERNRKDEREAVEDNMKYDRETDSLLIYEVIKTNDEIIDRCQQCAEEHEQLAEWLEELKKYHEIGTVEECKDAVENIEKFYQLGYNKSMDDIVEQLETLYESDSQNKWSKTTIKVWNRAIEMCVRIVRGSVRKDGDE